MFAASQADLPSVTSTLRSDPGNDPRSGWITLLSDFGLQDPYVGMMKGVIAQLNPNVQVIDLTHQIPPQNVLAGRFALLSAFPYFPVGSVHVAVVDPGVGTQRRGIAVQLAQGFLVGPDNGLLTGVIDSFSVLAAVELTDPTYWRSSQPSSTFHGRDIFAPVAAHVAAGVPLSNLGSDVDPASLVRLARSGWTVAPEGIQGFIQSIDRFGNLITTLPGSLVADRIGQIWVGSDRIRIGRTFGEADPGELIAVVGSHGWLEIAVNGGSAAGRLQVGYEDPVCLRHD